MLPVCCGRGAVQGSGRVLHILAPGTFQLLSKHKCLFYHKRKFLFPIRKPLWVMGGEVAIGYVLSLWEGVTETLTWVEGAGNQHIWGFFCCQAAFTFHTEKKHVLQGEAQQNYKIIRYVDNSRWKQSRGRSYRSCIRKGMEGQSSHLLR